MVEPWERELAGGWEQDDLFERDGVVHRKAEPQSEAVLALLRHLERAGFPASPRVVEPGVRDGRELVTYIEGDVHDRPRWGEAALAELAPNKTWRCG